jgi:hypothetical protein
VSFRKTSSRLGLRTSRPRNDAPPSWMAFSIFWTSSVCSSRTLMFLWLSWTGSKPIFRMIPKALSSTDLQREDHVIRVAFYELPGESMAMIFPFEMMATVSARSSASSM